MPLNPDLPLRHFTGELWQKAHKPHTHPDTFAEDVLIACSQPDLSQELSRALLNPGFGSKAVSLLQAES
jgi:hypothetical protein